MKDVLIIAIYTTQIYVSDSQTSKRRIPAGALTEGRNSRSDETQGTNTKLSKKPKADEENQNPKDNEERWME